MTHILETANSTDINIFQQGMQAARIGLYFDPLADKFWQAGHQAYTEQMQNRLISRPAKRSATSATRTLINT